MKFEPMSGIPKEWHQKGPMFSTFFNNLSIFFPAGERFFVRSVKKHLKFVNDETLRKEVMAFCGQEGIHSREHIRYNNMLKEQGYDIDAMDGAVEELLQFVEKVLPPRWCLAATCALEHFTALMGEILLSNEDILDGANEKMANLWRWHAAEENEHKAVAFDVYTAAGGNYVERTGIMVVATLIFWAKVLEYQARLMHEDGRATSPKQWLAFVDVLFRYPGLFTKLAGPYFEYYRPGFHPNDRDTRGLLDDWLASQGHAPMPTPQAA
ncbi:MAG: metal-dependent hydrolase [Polyangiales bacterium]